MGFSDAPVSESAVVTSFAKAFRLDPDQLYVPILQARSFIAGRLTMLPRIGSSLESADLESGPGLVECLKVLGGLVMVSEGLSVLTQAGAAGVAVASLLGVTVSAGTGILIGMGLFLLGAYLLYKGVQALWPFIRRRLQAELGLSLNLFATF